MAGETENVTISKAAYETLMKIKSMMDGAWDNKDTGAAFRKILKQVNPDLKIPDELAESAIAPVKTEIEDTRKQVKGLAERLDKFLSENKDEKDTAALRKDLADAQKKYGLDEEGMTKVMQRMKDKNNPDVEAAAAFIAASAPKPQPLADHGLNSVGADLFGTTRKEDDYAELHTGGDPFKPGGWFDKQAIKIMNEPTDQAA